MQTQTEERTQAHSKHRQKSGQYSQTHSHSDGGVDKPGTGIGTDITDADIDGGMEPGIQQTPTEEGVTQLQPQS